MNIEDHQMEHVEEDGEPKASYRPKKVAIQNKSFMPLLMMGCLFIGLILFSGVAFFLLWSPSSSVESLSKASVLSLDLSGTIREYTAETPLDQLFNKKELFLHDYVALLAKAKNDKNVQGIWLQIEQNSLGLAQSKELREALADFATSGKTLISSGSIWGEKELYLGSVANKIYLQPEAMVFFDGLSSSSTFYGAFFEKFGVRVHVEAKGEYKSYADAYRYSEMTEPNRSALAELLDALQAEILEPIANSRKLEVSDLEAALALPVYDVVKAQELRLIDGLKYADQIQAEFANLLALKNTSDLNAVEAKDYYSRDTSNNLFGGDAKIAVIHARGAIYPGYAQKGLFGDEVIGSDRFIAQLKAARQDDHVKAIILRIDSPGGSAIASDNMWREIRLTREMGKPVIASLGNYAASGGYYMAMACQQIFAEPGTITGSIGIVAMRPDVEKLLQDLKLNVDVVKTAPSADFFDLSRGLTPQEVELFHQRIEAGYHSFVAKAAESRGVSFDELEPNARGRVWTGREALKRGLVDELGNLDDAIASAAQLANIDKFQIINFPKDEKDLLSLFNRNSSTKSNASLLKELSPILPEDVRILLDMRYMGQKAPFELLAISPTLIEIR